MLGIYSRGLGLALFFSHLFIFSAFPSATMVPRVTPINGGARITANFRHDNAGNKVTVTLFTEVTDQKGDRYLMEIEVLDDQFIHRSTSGTRTYDIDYAKVNADLQKRAPNANLSIGPGTPMWVLARWIFHPNRPNPYDGSTLGSNHYYGGTGKNGGITLPMPTDGWNAAQPIPKNSSNKKTPTSFTKGGTVTDLDVANNIDPSITKAYPGMKGSLGSRYERELKLHIDPSDFKRVSTALEDLSKDPQEVERLFGAGATMREDRTYVNKPMIDVYRDNPNFDGAKNGTAFRFRTGNGVTSLNFKPDDGQYRGNGVFDRIEYQGQGISTPKSVEKFMDSNHPMNFLQLLREVDRKSDPSDFLEPAVKITDKRRKFKLKLPTGEEVEFSLDKFIAKQMNGNKVTGPGVEVAQLEIEVDHLGAQGSTNFSTVKGNQKWNNQFDTLHGAKLESFLKGLQPGSGIGGNVPVALFHGEKDFNSSSPMQKVNASTFQNTSKIFATVRKHLFPNGFGASGQKYAVAAAALGLVDYKDWAPSVKLMVSEQLGKKSITKKEAEICLAGMVKLAKK